MLTRQRQQHILNALRRDGQIVAKALSAELGLSEDTIRRDLRELAREGLLQRVHGGALPASPAMADLGVRRTVSVGEKRAIGRAAAALLKPGQVAFIDGGTTALELARCLDPRLRATVATHSPIIAAALAEHHGIEVILIGGRLFRHSMVSVGADAIEAISRIRADAYFMGATGIHPQAGLSTGDAEEAAVKRALMRAAAEIVVMASPEKLGAASPYVIAPVSQASVLITTRAMPPGDAEAYEALGLSVLIAPD
jgi:DeoR/GlpR family transcriptional regulator of sugar metabolism